MKRKLIPQKNSFTITLPKDWIDAKKLSGGDTIDIEESKGSLVINSSVRGTDKEYVIDVSNYSDRFIRNLLNQLYILSATRITIRSRKSSKLLICKKICSLFMVGFEVTSEEKGTVVLELLASPSEDSFNKYFMKMFNIMDYSLQLLEKGPKDKADIKRGTKKLTQYKNICRRLIGNNLKNDIQQMLLAEMINQLTEINHLIFHISENNISIRKKECSMVSDMYSMIKKGYLREDVALLDKAQASNTLTPKQNQFVFALMRNLYNLSITATNLIYAIEK